QHRDRTTRLAQPPDDLDSVESRQHPVEDDDVVAVLRRERETGHAVLRGVEAELPRFEEREQVRHEAQVVLDHQNTLGHLRAPDIRQKSDKPQFSLITNRSYSSSDPAGVSKCVRRRSLPRCCPPLCCCRSMLWLPTSRPTSRRSARSSSRGMTA